MYFFGSFCVLIGYESELNAIVQFNRVNEKEMKRNVLLMNVGYVNLSQQCQRKGE